MLDHPVTDLPPSHQLAPLDSEELRRQVLGDLLTEAEMGRAIPSRTGKPKSHRQMERLVAKGMPYVRIGRERYFDPGRVREWLASQITARCAPPRLRSEPGVGRRRPGRPRLYPAQ